MKRFGYLLPPLLLLLLASFALLSDAAQVGETCSVDGDCDAGLHCESCGGEPSRCVLIRPTDPKSKGMDLPFNRYSWLTTHNSYAQEGWQSITGTPLVTFTNQLDTVAAQLNNGVRGLMLDMYDFDNDIWLCHSFNGKCFNFTAFQPAINVLKQIQTFLEANPSEVVTIFIEDYVSAPQSLPNLFNASGLMPYWFPLSSMPKNGGNWPLLSDMIKQNQRLLVFTSIKAKQASEGIAYEWNYVVENQYGDDGMIAGTCTNRAESSPLSNTSMSLVLMNYFPTDPNDTTACTDNSAPLLSMLDTCYNSSGHRWANYIAVDFYTLSTGGGAQQAVDVANGHLVCGCADITYCKVNATFGTCVAPPPASAPTKAPTPGGVTPGVITNRASDASFIEISFMRSSLFAMASIAVALLL